MSPKKSTLLLVVPGLLLLAACSSDRGGGTPGQSAGGVDSAIIVDNEVRTYVEQKLRPYLTSLAKATCSVRATSARRSGRHGICVAVVRGRPGVEALDDPKMEGVTPPPKNGKPFPQPDTVRGRKIGVDNEVSDYFENKLRPYLDSLAHVTCAVRAKAAPRAKAYGLCPSAETINKPPKNRAPYPAGKVRPAADNELRVFIETALVPWLQSLSHLDCELRALLAGSAGRYGICLQSGDTTKEFPPLVGYEGEVVTVPPKNGKPYPEPDVGRPGAGALRQ